MQGPDLIIRELANGFYTIFTLYIAILFWRFGWASYQEEGFLTARIQASFACALFLLSSLIVRSWAWFFLWQQTHGFAPTIDVNWALISMAAGTVFGSFLVYRLTPPGKGHKPWLLALFLSWAIPILLHVVPLYLSGR